MPKSSEELTNTRKKEIISACKKLYETMSFREITIKEISNSAPFTRTLIYHYFQTKEEIFLAILQEEYEKWNAELEKIHERKEKIKRTEFAEFLAVSLSERRLLLKILSMNLYDIEENSSIEKLTEFKKQFGKCLFLIDECLKKVSPEMSRQKRSDFIYSFFPFVYGIYPYTSVTDKQSEAMKLAGIDYNYYSVYDITLSTAKKLLEVD